MFAQSDEKAPTRGIPAASISFRAGGWAIPKARYAPNRKSVKGVKGGIEVQYRAMLPYVKVVDYENYFIRSDKELDIFSEKRAVEAMFAISVKGKVFAYEVTYSPYVGKNINVTGIYEVFYVDNDGDGLFEEQLHTLKLETVPEWVKK